MIIYLLQCELERVGPYLLILVGLPLTELIGKAMSLQEPMAQEPSMTHMHKISNYQAQITFVNPMQPFFGHAGGALDCTVSGVNIKFIPEKYAYNVQQMSKVWVLWFKTILDDTGTANWLGKAIPHPFNIEDIQSTLMKLSSNESEVAKFSISR